MNFLVLAVLALGLICSYLVIRIIFLLTKNFSTRLAKLQPYLLILTGVIGVPAAIYISFYLYPDTFSYAETDQEESMISMFFLTLGFTGFVFVATQLLLFLFPFIFRSRPGRKVKYQKGNIKMELLWTTIPFLTFSYLFVKATIAWAGIVDFSGDKDPIVIEVVGEQFSWNVRYAGKDMVLGAYSNQLITRENYFGLNYNDPYSQDDFTSVQLHIPKDYPVKIVLHSRDVIHSFYIPAFKMKMDALPGMKTSLDFITHQTTEEARKGLNKPDFNYEVACAELCGRMHFAMLLPMIVEEQDEFWKWYNSQESLYTNQESEL